MPLLLLTYLGFMSLGLPDAAAGVAWPFVRSELGVAQGGLGLMLICTGAGYLVSALLAGRILARLGVANVLTASTALVAAGLAGYSVAPTWPLFLACGPLIGLGSGAIDAGLNHFAASRFSARHMSWLHAFYGVGATTGPLLFTLQLTHGLTWRNGYLTLALVQAAAALAFFAARSRFSRADGRVMVDATPATAADALRSRLVWLQILLFLVYAGLEVTVGQWSFTVQAEGAGAGIGAAGLGTTLYWLCLTLGRFSLGFVTERLGAVSLLRFSTALATVGCAAFAFGGRALQVPSLAVVGFSLAPVYPTLMSETPRRLGARLAAHAVGWQVGAAMLGALVLPSSIGWIAQTLGVGVIGKLATIAAVLMVALHEALVRLAPTPIRSRPGI